MVRKPGKDQIPRRPPPDLPPSTDDLRLLGADDLSGNESLQQSLITAVDLSKRILPGLTARNSVLDHVSLAGCVISSSHLRDVRLLTCDLSNVILHASEATRVEFINCRLTGFRAIECRWRHVLIENCDARYAQFTGGKLLGCEFRKSQLADSDLRSTNLEGTIFADAILTRADLTGANLQGVDLRTSEIENIIIQAEDVRGAIVTPAQALDLSRLLGLIVK